MGENNNTTVQTTGKKEKKIKPRTVKYTLRVFFLGVLCGLIGVVAFRLTVQKEAMELVRGMGDSGILVVDTVSQSINDIGELYVMDYSYTILNSTKDPKTLFGLELPFGAKEMQYLYSGDLRVGVDMKAGRVEEHGDTITITFPNMIAHNTVDETSVEIFDFKNYIFTRAALEKFQSMRTDSIEDVKRKVEENSIYDKTKDNLQIVLTGQIQSVLDALKIEDEYQVEVVFENEEIVYMNS